MGKLSAVGAAMLCACAAHRPAAECESFARAAWSARGQQAPEGRSLYAAFSESGRLRGGPPRAGDVVFFRDPSAPPGAEPAHAGVVERADADGTLVVAHRLAGGVARLRMNLAHPSTPRDPASGRRWNDLLQSGGQRRTLAQLYAARAPSAVSVAKRSGHPPPWPQASPGPARPAR